MPGPFYQMIGEMLGEKLPLLIFTNRTSFTVSLDCMVSSYEDNKYKISTHRKSLESQVVSTSDSD